MILLHCNDVLLGHLLTVVKAKAMYNSSRYCDVLVRLAFYNDVALLDIDPQRLRRKECTTAYYIHYVLAS